MTTFLLTRHAHAQAWARRRGLVIDRVMPHLNDLDAIQAGDVVIGIAPIGLAAAICAKGARYVHLSLDTPLAARGQELTPEEMDRYGARLERFDVIGPHPWPSSLALIPGPHPPRPTTVTNRPPTIGRRERR